MKTTLIHYARLCGRTLARAHARSGDLARLPDTCARARPWMMRLRRLPSSTRSAPSATYDRLMQVKSPILKSGNGAQQGRRSCDQRPADIRAVVSLDVCGGPTPALLHELVELL